MTLAHVCLSLGPYVHVLTVGPQIEALTGVRADDLLSGRVTLEDCIHPEDRALAQTLLAPVLEQAQGSVTLRLRQASGQVRRVTASYRKERALGNALLLALQLDDAEPATAASASATAPPRPDDLLAAVAGIDGLDVATGVRLLAGHGALYLRLLRKFVDGQADAPARIASSMAQGDWDGAERAAHTLKGVSAQIGAAEVRLAAERLEHAMRKREPAARLDELQADLTAPLTTLIHALTTRLPDEAPR